MASALYDGMPAHIEHTSTTQRNTLFSGEDRRAHLAELDGQMQGLQELCVGSASKPQLHLHRGRNHAPKQDDKPHKASIRTACVRRERA